MRGKGWLKIRLSVLCACGLAVVLMATGEVAAAEPVDLALVIASDVSTSMSYAEKRMQQKGFVEAFRHPRIIEAMKGGRTGKIAVTYMEWGGRGRQEIIVPWTIIDGEASAWSFSMALEANFPATLRSGTAMGDALQFASTLFGECGCNPERSVINISGDGTNNIGKDIAPVRLALLAQGVTINGLPIALGDPSNEEQSVSPQQLISYFYREVIGGPGAFSMPVLSHETYPPAIYRKLLREISGAGEFAEMH
jgi:Protein of unknown function (DUF1194)